MGWLFLLFVVLPLVDLWALLAVGEVLGFWPTVVVTVGMAALGAFLGKREGRKVFAEWRASLRELRMPEDGLVSAALVLVGAVLLASPGFLTDFVGIALLAPWTRRPIARLVKRAIDARMQRAMERGTLRVQVVSRVAPPRDDDRPDVVDAEAEVVDDEPPKALPARSAHADPE